MQERELFPFRAPKRQIYPQPPPGTSRLGASPDRGFSILFLILFSNGLWDAFFSPLDTSRTILEPNMTPTWVQFATMLDHFSDIFGVLFWHLNIRSFLRRFLIDFRPPASSKNIAPANVFEDFCICFMIALETDLGPILAPFWNPKSIQNRSRNG